jgi:hypothetical protein
VYSVGNLIMKRDGQQLLLDIKGYVMAAKESSLLQADINQVFREKYRQLPDTESIDFFMLLRKQCQTHFRHCFPIPVLAPVPARALIEYPLAVRCIATPSSL